MRTLLFALLLAPALCLAAIESRQFDDPAQETRYHALIDKLRCLVCQNQNLADSNADLARDLRDKTFEMITAGRSDEEITDFMVARYGEFVLYEPPLNMHTVLLWLAPALLAGVGAGVFVSLVRRRRRDDGPAIDDDAREKARHLLSARDR